jgi:hypothetical protein
LPVTSAAKAMAAARTIIPSIFSVIGSLSQIELAVLWWGNTRPAC